MAPATDPFLVTAGGSMFFDVVVEHLGRAALPQAQLVLRPGSYVSHDSIHYDDASPLGRSAPNDPAGRLRPAFEVWSVVLSRPEPGLAILGMGKRDVPVDLDLPLPLYHSRAGSLPASLGQGYHFFRVQDQHAYLRLPLGADLAVGDLVGCGISHPCTTFDKWRVLLLVDEARKVIGAVRTYF
jgi:D-serine dehydratase